MFDYEMPQLQVQVLRKDSEIYCRMLPAALQPCDALSARAPGSGRCEWEMQCFAALVMLFLLRCALRAFLANVCALLRALSEIAADIWGLLVLNLCAVSVSTLT